MRYEDQRAFNNCSTCVFNSVVVRVPGALESWEHVIVGISLVRRSTFETAGPTAGAGWAVGVTNSRPPDENPAVLG